MSQNNKLHLRQIVLSLRLLIRKYFIFDRLLADSSCDRRNVVRFRLNNQSPNFIRKSKIMLGFREIEQKKTYNGTKASTVKNGKGQYYRCLTNSIPKFHVWAEAFEMINGNRHDCKIWKVQLQVLRYIQLSKFSVAANYIFANKYYYSYLQNCTYITEFLILSAKRPLQITLSVCLL